MKPVAPVSAMRGLPPTGVTAALRRSMDASYDALTYRMKATVSGSACLPLQPGGAGDALPFGQVVADEGGEFFRRAAGHVKTLPRHRVDDLGRFRSLVGCCRKPLDDVAIGAGRREQPEPAGGVEAGNPGFRNGRQLRRRARAVKRRRGERNEPAIGDE